MGWNFASFWFQIQSPLYRALVSGLWMTCMDLLIEQVAPQLDYWLFTFNIIPWQNYLAWWWLGSAFSLIWNVTNQKTKWTPVFMGVAQLMFFLILVMVF
jgi:putative membrane protein